MLTLQFIPYSHLSNLDPEHRLKKILDIVKEDKIILLEGRLQEKEEAELIKKTMEHISDKFRGIELSVIDPDGKDTNFYKKVQKMLVNFLLGKRAGFTIIGPANIIKEIKKDPDKIELLTKENFAVEKKDKK